MNLTTQEKQALESSGYYAGGIKGGPIRVHYWKPCGCEVFAIRSERGYVKKDANGKVTEQGIRDANLDKGWLLAPPEVLKPCCNSCGEWHDTPELVAECNERQRLLVEKSYREAIKEYGNPTNDRLDRLEAAIESLTRIMEVQHRTLLQSEGTEYQCPESKAEGGRRPETDIQG
jgi:hypothetical protein